MISVITENSEVNKKIWQLEHNFDGKSKNATKIIHSFIVKLNNKNLGNECSGICLKQAMTARFL
jgi:hypothetical protein